MTLSELRTKDVICTRDGKKLGRVNDLEFDGECGCIQAVIVPGEWKAMNVIKGEKSAWVIPWSRICKIGENVILVHLEEGETEEI